MSKQTQGPWVIDWATFPDGYVWLETTTGRAVALVDEVIRADLNLIAAAPDLFEALQEMVSAYSNHGHPITGLSIASSKARAAIKKAMGEE